MARPFKLRRRVDLRKLDVPGDVAAVEKALEKVGYYEHPVFGTGRSALWDLNDAIRQLQTDGGLKPDGVIEPDGPTAEHINALLTGRRRRPDNPSADTLIAEARRERAAEQTGPGDTPPPGQPQRGLEGMAAPTFRDQIRDPVQEALEEIDSGKGVDREPAVPIILGPPTDAPVDVAKMYRELQFDPSGPGEWSAALDNPVQGATAFSMSLAAQEATKAGVKMATCQLAQWRTTLPTRSVMHCGATKWQSVWAMPKRRVLPTVMRSLDRTSPGQY